MIALWILLLFAAAILAYFFIGWLTIWIYYAVAYLLVLITDDNEYAMHYNDKERIMWAWPIMFPFVLLVLLFYVPYVTLLKLTPRSPT